MQASSSFLPMENPTSGSTVTDPGKPFQSHPKQEEEINAAMGSDNAADTSTLQSIKDSLHDIKENVKETLQRDHPRGQEYKKKPQDGMTNPME
ncbi:uncharacterized protein BX663DRAFT_106538 [Cokeromyces recurvatus]|uniref:uncharacterized protein n=1 Tax=Cokeromyces recurvatus TaxID=90255 RepID=UPI00221E6ED1|nr:uncharacterized protein BX663DRAFT_106538 [Cokeromyces recurvatus]KAI7901385.1 hypothetical protein BX663DRAFT_106538 [Cokeromyces recurvatus]